MRPSPLRHTLAVLRNTIGLTQKEFADVAECSTPTIQAIELGKLNLSDKLAELIAHNTGVSLKWLLANDVTKPPIDDRDNPYTREYFEQFQALSQAQQHRGIASTQAFFAVFTSVERVTAICLRAYKNGQAALAAYKLSKAFEDLEKHFGVTEKDLQDLDEAAELARKKDEENGIKGALDHQLKGFVVALDLETKKKPGTDPHPKLKGHAIFKTDGQVVYSPTDPADKKKKPAARKKA